MGKARWAGRLVGVLGTGVQLKTGNASSERGRLGQGGGGGAAVSITRSNIYYQRDTGSCLEH